MKISLPQRRRRLLVVDGIVIGAILLGWIIIGIAVQRMGLPFVVGVSAAACWVALVFSIIFAYDILAALFGWPALQPFVHWHPPAPVRRWSPLVCLAIGLIFGRLFW